MPQSSAVPVESAQSEFELPESGRPKSGRPESGRPESGAIAAEDALRAQGYRLLAHFLTAPPSQQDLDAGAALSGDDTALGRAITCFANLCGKSAAATVAEEYQDLFIGIGRGELVPYGSYYLTGFLQEKPLAKLRQEMARLGLERDPDSPEPEDHIASILEMMAGFIDGTPGPLMSLGEQKQFYDVHLGAWVETFFRDLEDAKASVLYAALAGVGRAFFNIEERGFEMA